MRRSRPQRMKLPFHKILSLFLGLASGLVMQHQPIQANYTHPAVTRKREITPTISAIRPTFDPLLTSRATARMPEKLRRGCPSELRLAHNFKHFLHTCRSHSALALIAYEGVLDATEQCREQMRFQTWDCSQPGTLLHEPTILQFGYRESAYLFAISAAGAAWGVATACAKGWLEECKCTGSTSNFHRRPYSLGAAEMSRTPIQRGARSTLSSMPSDWEWRGCAYGVQYGMVTSRKLLTRSGGPRSVVRRLEKHNLKVGRIAVKRTLVESCKCHGVSGSCQQQTCWKKAADLPTIAADLTEKYQQARMVTSDFVKARSTELVYTERSPDSCSQFHYDLHLKKRGSAVRICNWRNETHSLGDCFHLCCGRGHTVTHEMVSYKCDCKFAWCCRLECKDCYQHRWVSTCNN